jgi:hypothetical protein
VHACSCKEECCAHWSLAPGQGHGHSGNQCAGRDISHHPHHVVPLQVVILYVYNYVKLGGIADEVAIQASNKQGSHFSIRAMLPPRKGSVHQLPINAVAPLH